MIPGDLVEIIVPLEAGDYPKGILLEVSPQNLRYVKILSSGRVITCRTNEVRKVDETG